MAVDCTPVLPARKAQGRKTRLDPRRPSSRAIANEAEIRKWKIEIREGPEEVDEQAMQINWSCNFPQV
jgi:hypothetical protein